MPLFTITLAIIIVTPRLHHADYYYYTTRRHGLIGHRHGPPSRHAADHYYTTTLALPLFFTIRHYHVSDISLILLNRSVWQNYARRHATQ